MERRRQTLITKSALDAGAILFYFDDERLRSESEKDEERLMRGLLFAVAAVVAAASLSGCASWDIGKGKGKGKAPPPVYEEPAPAPVYK
jgi:hypothetical protein